MNHILKHNVNKMKHAARDRVGMDYIIISTGDKEQERYWEDLLIERGGNLIKAGAYVIVVVEDWTGGAGNGLGTLYAYHQAAIKAKKYDDIDLDEELLKGKSFAIYHTAGKGKRLAPLSCSEHGNKPAIKIPGYLADDISYPYVTILEAVMKQTSIYSPSRKGRVSVFWGDQIFIPSTSCDYISKHHIDILGILKLMPSKKEWEEKELSKYGLLAVDPNGNAKLIDKCTYDEIHNLMKTKEISIEGGVGLSLGSFSMSASSFLVFLKEFNNELLTKNGKLDSDPHFWMPLCLNKEYYIKIMQKKNMSEEKAGIHYDRIRGLINKFVEKNDPLSLFGVVDVGADCLWWDYGTTQTYYNNVLKLINSNLEAQIMREFYNISPLQFDETQRTCILNCEISTQKIDNSVLVGVKASSVETKDSVIVDCLLKDLNTRKALLYHVNENDNLFLEDQTIRADVEVGNQGEIVKLYSSIERNGEKDWNNRILSNRYSYEEISKMDVYEFRSQNSEEEK